MARQHTQTTRPRVACRSPPRISHRNSRGLLLGLGLALSTPAAAQTSAFTDQATGIQFQRFFGARTNFGFGVALPTNPSNSFIGQLSFPLNNGNGYGGFSLTGDMEGPLLMACWSDGAGNVVASLRQAFNEDDNPPEVTGNFAVRPIATGTSVNNTFLTFTFLCEGCLDDSLGLGASRTAGQAEMGWALASSPVRNAASSNGILGFHNSGFGDFRANLAAARNAEFDTWAALAGAPLQPSAGAQAFDPNAGSGDEDSGDDGDDRDDDDDDDFFGGGGGGAAAPGGATGGATGGTRGGNGDTTRVGGGAVIGGGRGNQAGAQTGTGGGRFDDDSDDDSDDD
ncbi:hypothetical protein OQA88_4757 [Cercophora sp. LCS_1]